MTCQFSSFICVKMIRFIMLPPSLAQLDLETEKHPIFICRRSACEKSCSADFVFLKPNEYKNGRSGAKRSTVSEVKLSRMTTVHKKHTVVVL